MSINTYIIFFIFGVLNLAFAADVPTDLPSEVKNEIEKIEDTQKVEATKKNDDTQKINIVAQENLNAKTNLESKKESDIPLNIENGHKVIANSEKSGQVFYVVFVLLGFGIGFWILLRKLKTKNISRNRNEIKVLAQHYLGPKKSIAVIRVAGESILIGVSDHNINLIKTLALLDDELPEVKVDSFSKELSSRSENNENNEHESIDEFSFSGIKDVVSTKLKGMRSL